MAGKDDRPLFRHRADFDPRVCPAPLRDRSRGTFRAARAAIAMLLVLCGVWNSSPRKASAQLELPQADSHQPLRIVAATAHHWTEGVYDVWWLEGNCTITQGQSTARAKHAVLWVERGGPFGNPPFKLLTYLEGDVSIETGGNAAVATTGAAAGGAAKPAATAKPVVHLRDERWFGRLYSTSEPAFLVPSPGAEPDPKPAVYTNAVAARNPIPAGAIQRTQFSEFGAPVTTAPVAAAAVPPGARRIRIFPRTDVPPQIQTIPSPTGSETTAVISGGVNLIIDGLPNFGSLDVSTDRLVIWTTGLENGRFSGEALQRDDTPLEIYLEGNVVFRQGNRIVQSPAMYFDVQQRIGEALDAELLTPLPTPKYPGLIRLRADVLRQVDTDRYVAQNASFTSSRLGEPTYELRSSSAVFEDIEHPEVNFFTGAPEVDPRTGEPRIAHEERVTARNDLLYVEGVPVFYWPVFSSDLERDNFFLNKAEVKQDSIFGTQALVEVDLYQLLGFRNT